MATAPHYNTLLHPESLKEYFLSGLKAVSDLQVGVEWEKIGIDRETGRAIPYSGARGVKEIFAGLEKRFGWKPAYSKAGEPIALSKGPCSITLEPGGQIELSGQKARQLQDNAAELRAHLAELREVSEPLGIVWLGIGAQPFSSQEEIEWVPKDRYTVMRQTLRLHGPLTFAMMKETASVQVSLDYTSEVDAVEKLRLAMALSPFLTALFANSPLEKGAVSGALSRRAQIWAGTDPARTGVLYDVFRPDFTLADYTRFALEVPALFIQRQGVWIALPRMSFQDFLRNGWNGYEAEPADWELHLSSLFTETRLKTYLEIRSVDCQAVPMGLAAVAFLKGLFYSENARRDAWKLLSGLTIEERRLLQAEAPRTALHTPFRDTTLFEPAQALVETALTGLPEGERRFLRPLREAVLEKKCPAERLVDCYSRAKDRRGQVDRVIDCAAI